MTLNSDAKFEKTLSFWFQKWHEELVNFHKSTQKWYFDRQKRTFKDVLWKIVVFWSKTLYMFQLENSLGIMCNDTEGWCKILEKTDAWLEKWHKEFG